MKIHTHTHTQPYHTPPSQAAGFTLVEILTVMAIIMALAAMTIGGMGYYKEKTAKSRTMVLMGGIESALEQYHFDTGEYPAEKATKPLLSTKVLYRALYGDGIGPDGIAGTDDDQNKPTGTPDEGATIYLPMLDPNRRGNALNLLWKDGKVIHVIADGWKKRLGYRCIPEGAPELMNPRTSFDLWSGGGKGNVANRQILTNWD